MNKFLFFGIIFLIIALPLSQLHKESLILEKNIEVDSKGKGQVVINNIFMKIGDKISISVNQSGVRNPLIISLKWFDKTVASTDPSIYPKLSWISNGESFYSIEIKRADMQNFQENITIHYEIARKEYYLPWLLPIGLIISISLIFIGISHHQFHGKRMKNQKSSSNIKLIAFCVTVFYKKIKEIDRVMLLLLVSFLFISLFLGHDMIHNDEIGEGKSDRWGYFGWGYVDTTNQIVSLVKKIDFSYESWRSVHNMGKPLLINYFMALLQILIPSYDALSASRLFVKIAAALACVAIYYLGKIMFNRITGLFASFFLFSTPIFLNYTRAAYLDGPLTFFIVLFLISLYKTSKDLNHKNVLLLGIALGFLISAKSILFLYPFALISFMWLLLSSRELNIKGIFRSFYAVSIMCVIAVSIFIIHWPLMWTEPLTHLNNLNLFLDIFGGNSFPPGPTSYLLFGNVVTNPPTIMLLFSYFTFQTTYIELIGFIIGFIYSLTTSSRNCKFLLLSFLTSFLIGTFTPGYQHEIIWLFPFWALIIGVGYEKLLNYLKNFIAKYRNYRKIFQKGDRLMLLVFFIVIIASQTFLIATVAPYYGLYYNKAFILFNDPHKIFSIPEPVYGLDQIATYLKYHSIQASTILTTTAPHTLQVYLPNFKVISTYGIQWEDDITNMLILRSLGIEYVLIDEGTIQLMPNYSLWKTLQNKAELEFVAKGAGIPLAYLFKIPYNNTSSLKLWSFSQNFKISSNIENYSISYQADKLIVNCDFKSGYPPYLFVKLYWDIPPTEVLNLYNASINMIIITKKDSEVTISLGLLDKAGNRVETTLRTGYLKIAERYVIFNKLSDYIWKGSSNFDFANVIRVELIFYNTLYPTSEVIVIEKMSFVR
jgi:4-amino-4-deoxy-L-arabinose transferase-like glycosyltransferase